MENSQNNPFTDDTKYNIMYLGDEEDMLPKYHNENAIYLYCTLEREAAIKIINTNVYNSHMVLYETPQIARAICKNIIDPVTLRIAVNLAVKEYYYDALTMKTKEIKDKLKVSIEDYKSKCAYTRELFKVGGTQYIIQYTINKPDKMLFNPQYI